ncbi:MAG: hypothetical protein IJP04_13075, partial [Clostridia bacterium]|nr:hypothetical protein [Clostridia bacterium]
MGPILGPIYTPQSPQKSPVSPGGRCFFKTKKHVKPLIYKHFTWYILEAPPRLELGNKDFADDLADAQWVS